MYNTIITGITSLLTDISTEMVYPLVPLYLSILGAPPSALGLIEGLAESTASILKVFSGWFSDRIGRRKPVAVAGYTGSIAGKLLLYASTGWGLVFAGRMVDRLGKGLRTAPRDALIADSTGKGMRGRAFGLHRALDTLGAAIGVVIAILLVTNIGPHLTRSGYLRIFLVSLIPAGLGVLVLLLARERAAGRSVAGVSATRAPEAGASAQEAGGVSRRYRASRRCAASEARPLRMFRALPVRLRWFLIVVGLFALGNSSNMFLLLRARDIGFSVVAVLSLYLLYNGVHGLLSYPAGRLADRIGKKRLLVAGYVIYGLVYVGFAFSPRVELIWVLFGVYGVYSALTEGLEKALVADVAPDEHRGAFIGLHATLVGIGLLPASLLAGALWSLWGPTAPFWFGGALGLMAALGLVFVL